MDADPFTSVARWTEARCRRLPGLTTPGPGSDARRAARLLARMSRLTPRSFGDAARSLAGRAESRELHETAELLLRAAGDADMAESSVALACGQALFA